MDALASQSAQICWSAVQLGVMYLGRILPTITTVAGTISPARVLVMRLGVTGLEAIATAHRSRAGHPATPLMFGPNFVRGIVVIGANDVVNPAVETDKYSPIFRITILNADQSKQVHVVKRGHGKGYTGAETVLDCEDRCALAYGGAQIVLIKRLEGVRGLGPAVAA